MSAFHRKRPARFAPYFEALFFYAFLTLVNHVDRLRLYLGQQFGWDLHEVSIDLSQVEPLFLLAQPSPYWLATLLFASRYGLNIGILTGFVSAGFFLMDHWFFGVRYEFETVGFFLQPSSFVVVGALVGLSTEKLKQARNEAYRRVDKLKDDVDRLNEELKTQRLVQADLEERITSQMTTIVTVYQGAKMLESLSEQQIYHSALSFFSKLLQVDTASIYCLRNDHWELTETWGDSENDNLPQRYRTGQGLVGLAGSAKKIVSLRDFVGYNYAKLKEVTESPQSIDIARECLVAGPITGGEQGDVRAVYVIHKMPLFKLSGATINVLRFLLDWASGSVGRALHFRDLQAHELIDPQTKVYSRAYFDARLSQEFLKSQSYYLPLSVCFVRLVQKDTLPVVKQERLILAVAQVLKESVRDIDFVARFSDQLDFVVLLSTATKDTALELTKKLGTALRKLPVADPITIELSTGSFEPKQKQAEDLIDEAQRNWNAA